LYLVATIVGEVTPVTVVPGLKISAHVVANTSVPLFVLEVSLLYYSPVFDAELNATVTLPLANCRPGDALSLSGKISVHIGAPGTAGDITATAAASKRCDRVGTHECSRHVITRILNPHFSS
jgi:hypothetical protein